ncbi:MAG: hypothetical protein MJE68_25830 [Proteobacteria bacterium]|nr:hypothetical protein [Pseudomonadota bacterium]
MSNVTQKQQEVLFDIPSALSAGWEWFDAKCQWLSSYGMPFLNKHSDLQNILGMVGIALLTILIPMAIAAFSDDNKEEDFFVLDRRVALHEIFKGTFLKVPRFLYSVGLVFVPLMIWQTCPPLMLFLWFVGICLIVKTIAGVYDVMEGKKTFEKRFTFLKRIQPSTYAVECWRSAWQANWEKNEIGHWNESKFFSIFSDTITALMKKATPGNLQLAANLLVDFYKYINKRPSYGLINSGILPKILCWHYMYFNLRRDRVRLPIVAVPNKKWLVLSDNMTSNILQEVTKIAFTKITLPSSFSQHFEDHLDKVHPDGPYMASLIKIIFDALVENTEDKEASNKFWKRLFPKDWKITIENLQGKNALVPYVLLHYYYTWSGRRISRGGGKEYDQILDDVSCILLPKIDPPTWANLLIFLHLPYSPDEGRVATSVKNMPSFWHGSETNRDEENRERTLEIILWLILSRGKVSKDSFSDQLSNFIKEARDLEGKCTSSREKKRLKLFVGYFKDMQEMLPELKIPYRQEVSSDSSELSWSQHWRNWINEISHFPIKFYEWLTWKR